MKIRIDGRELVVRKTTRAMVDLQRQAGWRIDKLTEAETFGYAAAMSAFFALHNAGFNPSWDELLDRDIEDFQFVQEPGDERTAVDAGDDAVDPPSSPADSDPGVDEGAPSSKATPGSKRSTAPKAGSKTR